MIKKQIKHLNLPLKEGPQVIYCGEGGCRQATNTAGWKSWTKAQQSQEVNPTTAEQNGGIAVGVS